MNQTPQIDHALMEAYTIATAKRHEFVTPEHMLVGFLKDADFWDVIEECGRAQELEDNLYAHLNSLETMPEGQYNVEFSEQFKEMFSLAGQAAASSGQSAIHVHHMIFSIFQLEDSTARFNLENCLECSVPDFLNALIGYSSAEEESRKWERYFREMEDRGTFIGKKDELSRIMRLLCRYRKANVLLVGARGVGKTAIACEAARLLQDKRAWNRHDECSWEEGLDGEVEVPAKLHGMRIMELDTTLILGGAQYRGDLEMRVKEIIEGVRKDGNTIIYIDDLKALGGNSRNDDGSKDILAILTPYLKSGEVRCIVSATHEDIKKVENLNPGAMNLFYQIELSEPSEDECLQIIKANSARHLSSYYDVRYTEDACRYAIKMSMRHLPDRCLPEKAIDLLDQAGSYCAAGRCKEVNITWIDMAIKDICRGNISLSTRNANLRDLETRLKKHIYGQDEAITKVTEAILMSKAGLTESGKTIGSFLFVGPTGVGKTELTKVLAEELDVPLHRFDMSEYSEKHSVAKLIGSPAGYVGYDDGGILTDAIRKNPYCVLLLDEIEKAHEDIYNLLLQVMDYAVISDNKGRKVDFRNVVLIMTSNAGARYAKKASVGFDSRINAGAAMAKEVRNVFAPEFINRLTSVVVFNDMDEKMAGLILDEKIARLQKRLDAKEIRLEISPEAYQSLLKEGFSPTYGAREIERILNSRITPMLMREILFGERRAGFTAVIGVDSEGGYTLTTRV